MDKAREIVRMDGEGMTQREIAASTGCSLGSVNMVLSRMKESGVADPLALRQGQLAAIIYPAGKKGKEKAEPDLEYIRREMAAKGATLIELWKEYKEQHPSGYMLTQFCERFRAYCKANNVYMRKVYAAGERMMVDWAGLTLTFTDKFGENRKAYFFVSCLPASNYLFTEPWLTMTQEAWNMAHVHAVEYFGGSPRLWESDNAKTAVKKASNKDPEINASYAEEAAFYGAAIVPTRPRSPRDKAPVENAVLIIERKIIAPLKRRQFHSIEELREAVREELEKVNTAPFAKAPGSRRELFLEVEKQTLRPLPTSKYEYADWKAARVGFDYHAEYDGHFYSVPYDMAGKMIRIRAANTSIEVFYEGERIATHPRCYDPHKRYSTIASHMPPAHRAVASWSSERFRSWAAEIGPSTEAYIVSLMKMREQPEQAFRLCAGILRMGKEKGKAQLEKACGEAAERHIYSWKYFKTLFDDSSSSAPTRALNVRGPDYYRALAEEAFRAQ
jgi:transposase